MRIDVHAHLFSKPYIDGLRRVFGNDQSPAGQDAQRLIKWMSTDPRMTEVEGRLEEMEKWGVGMQVLSVPFHGALVTDKSAAADLTHMANDMIVQPSRAHPDHFRVLLTLPLQFPELAIEVLDSFVNEPKVVGAALMGTAGGRPLNDPAFMPVYAELERRGLPFLLHPISPPGLDCMLEMNLANVVGFMFETTLAATRRRVRAAREASDDLSPSRRPGAVSHGPHSVGLRALPALQRKFERAAGKLFQALLLRYRLPQRAGAAYGALDVRRGPHRFRHRYSLSRRHRFAAARFTGSAAQRCRSRGDRRRQCRTAAPY